MSEQVRPSWMVIVGWSFLASIIGLVVGSVVGYIWSNAQIHTTQTGYVLRGDHRAMIVIGHAILGGLATAVIAAACTMIGLTIRRKRGPKNDGKLDKVGNAT